MNFSALKTQISRIAKFKWDFPLKENNMFGNLFYDQSQILLPHFRQKYWVSDEITIVKTVEKTWSTVLRVEKLVPIPKKQEVPNLDITYLVRYVFETLPWT